MQLNLGGLEKIDAPTSEDLRHYLRFMPAESPFIVLHGDDGHFMQAVYSHKNDAYRVEHKRNGRQFFVHVDYSTAASLFESYLVADGAYESAVRWKRMTIWNTPGHPLVIWLVILLVLGILAFQIWSEFFA